MKVGFNKQTYLKKQTEEILKRIDQFDNKLYIEFGGKLFDDYHASRVLPGFKPDTKIELLKQFKDRLEIIFVINAADIEKRKIRADKGITYDLEVIRLINELSSMGLEVNSVVITQFVGQPMAVKFQKKLERNNIKTYIHRLTKGYPNDVDTIVSDEGYGANPYIETTKPLVIVTAPGASSGKLATCLSQLYHEYKKGIKSGYAKFETFPIWNIPLKHPINMAYEASTADINDTNMIDNYHYDTYGLEAVSYNRDLMAFPILKSILEKIMGNSIYNSPTDMGVNMAGFAIEDDEICQDAARQEVIRRYYKECYNFKEGLVDESVPKKVQDLINEMDIDLNERKVVKVANDKTKKTGLPAFSIQVSKSKCIVGRETDLFTAPASCFLNAIKYHAKLNDSLHLMSPFVLEPAMRLKKDLFKDKNDKLNLYDVLLGLSILEATNPMVEIALKQASKLMGTEAHSSFILSPSDESVLRSLGINYTCEPQYYLNNMYIED